MCGKTTNQNHRNGIDRYDNSIGYVLEYSMPCCGGCNYMKRDYSYSDVSDKFKMIYIYNNKKVEATISPDVLREICIPSVVPLAKSNIKSVEQAREDARLKKQRQRAERIAVCGKEEYNKGRAKEAATNRANKKLRDAAAEIEKAEKEK